VLSFLVQTNELNPSLHSHYRNFVTTTIQSATSLRIGFLWNTLNPILNRRLSHIAMIVSHVPYKSLCKVPAALIPVDLQSVCGLSITVYPIRSKNPIVWSTTEFVSRRHRTVHFRSAPLHLPDIFMMPFLHRSIP
jgi:hypothetical protein